MQVEQTWVYRAAKYAMNQIKTYLDKHPDVAAAFLAGGFLASPAGKTLMKGIFTKIVPMLAKFEIEAGKASAKLIGEVVNQLLVSAKIKVDPKVVAEASKIGPDTSKLNEGGKKIAKGGVILTAAVVAGQMIGSYFGNTVASFKGYKDESTLTKISRVVFPAIHSVTDWVEELKASKQETMAQLNKKTEREVARTKELSPKESEDVSFSGEPNKTSGYSGINYDDAARQLGLSPRPSNAQAENEWKKEVEKQMSKTKASKFNGPAWYFQGLAQKILGTTLTWTGLKDHTVAYPFVGATCFKVDLMLPTDGDKKLHHQIIANNNIVWQALRGKNTGAFQYTEEDVYSYTIALVSLIAVYRWTCKVISLTNKRDVEIENLPVMLMAAYYNSRLGTNTGKTNYLDIIANKSSYVTQINSIGKEINTYALKGTTLISRWNYIADKCIKDYNGPKAVYGFYGLEHCPSLGNSGITYTNIGGYTVPQLIAYMQAQLDLIRTYSSGVLLKVAGDMIKLLGANKETFNNVPYINGAEIPTFEFDPEAFDQIRNAKMLPTNFSTAPSYDRNTAAVNTCDIQAPSGNSSIGEAGCIFTKNNYLVTSDRKVEFKPEENLQMIQFIFNAAKTSDVVSRGFRLEITACGFTKLSHFSVVKYDANGDPETSNYTSIVTMWNGVDASAVSVGGVADTLHGDPAAHYTDWEAITRQIDFMPRMQMVETTATNSAFYSIAYDVDNYANITDTQFEQLNNVAVYSLTYAFNPEDVKIMGLLG